MGIHLKIEPESEHNMMNPLNKIKKSTFELTPGLSQPLPTTLQKTVAAKGDVPEPNNILDDSPPKFVNVADVSSLVANDENPSSSKACFHFGLSSSLEASDENNDLELNDVPPPPPKNSLEGHQYTPSQEAPQDDHKSIDGDDQKSESSTSDTRSSNENITDPFAILELRDNIVEANS
ncbi:unnamed protein product [Lactuca saligna]|uniref:Uncharacterized protein n=1 Tax=Lactuca saligna TaxID=75948 RepID=A0AA35YQ47_LACSI|nr:unnamed protein product [Lactuca saligna]